MQNWQNWKYAPLREEVRTVILDTDIGPDCDDAGALALLMEYRKMYGFPVAGVVNCTSNPHGNGAIRAITRFLGEEVVVAQSGQGGLLEDAQKYNRPIAEKYLPVGERTRALPALDFYQDALERAGDDSVVLVSIGQFTTLSELLDSAPELVDRKVHALVCMACAFPSGREFNVFMDAPAAQNVFARFPRPIICSGFEIGIDVLTGYARAPENAGHNPVYDAYRLYLEDEEDFRKTGSLLRPSFDLTAVQYAVEGESAFYALSGPLRIDIDPDGGNAASAWDGAGAPRYSLVKAAPNEAIAAHLNDLLHRCDSYA